MIYRSVLLTIKTGTQSSDDLFFNRPVILNCSLAEQFEEILRYFQFSIGSQFHGGCYVVW